MTIICCVILFVGKEYIDPPVKKRIRVPVPWDILLIVAGTVFSDQLSLATEHNVVIVGNIPQG